MRETTQTSCSLRCVRRSSAETSGRPAPRLGVGWAGRLVVPLSTTTFTLPEDLKNEAYDDHSGEKCLDYADRLEAALAGMGDEHLDEVIDIRAAMKWLRYWGSRGFGYSAWY